MSAPWEEDRKPFIDATKALQETVEASKGLDKFLTASEEPKPMSSKLMDFVDEVEEGIKDLEAEVDELRPRFAAAKEKGREHMTKFRGHVERAEAAIKKVEEFNKRAEGSNS